ncbi:Kelch domain-containing protein 1 [Thelohanellus kitauei]|uniref:Kelch domain-containing protein 1 n=1 Tax=Thelohanellus kitauei TaxID=669202 RepID=A0A0C2IL29_THEKT|nr:Kelch domain-containing protein 1 [Thelohanellus kitauei]
MIVEKYKTPHIDRSGHCMTTVGEFLVIYGGFDFWSGKMLSELLSYNTVSGILRRYQLPVETANAYFASSICSVGSLVYIFGGSYSPFTVQSTNSLISYDIYNSTCQTLSPHIDNNDQTTPPPMYGSCIFYHNGSVYVIGGIQSDGYTDSIHKFCLKTSSWSLVPQNGQKPYLEHRIFGTVFNNRYIKIFDISTDTWTTRETNPENKQYPNDRILESFSFSKNFGYLSGGKIPDTNKNYSDTLKTGLTLHCTSVVEDSYLYSFGGHGNISNYPNFLERFTVQPPTLYRLCLESIRRSPNLKSCISLLPPAIVDDLNLHNIDSNFNF